MQRRWQPAHTVQNNHVYVYEFSKLTDLGAYIQVKIPFAKSRFSWIEFKSMGESCCDLSWPIGNKGSAWGKLCSAAYCDCFWYSNIIYPLVKELPWKLIQQTEVVFLLSNHLNLRKYTSKRWCSKWSWRETSIPFSASNLFRYLSVTSLQSYSHS